MKDNQKGSTGDDIAEVIVSDFLSADEIKKLEFHVNFLVPVKARQYRSLSRTYSG